jgi:DNA-binding response OmpR family regulator
MSAATPREARHAQDSVGGFARRSRRHPKIPITTRRPRILLAEDDDKLRALLAWSLRRERYEVTEFRDGRELVSELGTFVLFGEPAGFDLVISDIRMPGATALEILEAMRECKGLPPVILITAFGDARTHGEAERIGVAAVFEKPFEVDDLLAKAQDLLDEDPARASRGATHERVLPQTATEDEE